MIKLIILLGLQGCGKSTFAKELVDKQGYKRVNKDDLRAMIDNGKWSRENEELIFAIERRTVAHILFEGYSVVVDDTNFAHEEAWKSLISDLDIPNAEFEIKDFDTPYSECVRRDALRGDKSVGEEVIYKTWSRYLKPKPIPYNKELKDCYIFDIDGTLAHMSGRSPYDLTRVSEDTLDEPTANILDAVLKTDARIIIVSGREEVCRDVTEKWLDDNDVAYSYLYMRPAGDKRKDTEVKKEIYKNNIEGEYNVLGIFDDRNSVVEMWRSLGLKCFQVDIGPF